MAKRKPKAKCWDRTWNYVPAVATNVAATFARIRRERAEAKAKPANVEPIKKAKRA